MHASRLNKFEDDKFASELGYSESLIVLLDRIENKSEDKSGLFAKLASSHPASDLQIAALQEREGEITEKFTY